MKLQGCTLGSIKTWIALCVGLFGTVVTAGVYAQCATVITIPDNTANTEIARFVRISQEGYIVRLPDGYILNTTDNTAFEADLNNSIVLVPGIDTGYDGAATVAYDSIEEEWIIAFTGNNSQLSHILSYWNGTTQTCPGGVQGYCGSTAQITSVHNAECAASYFENDSCANSASCGAPSVGTGYCFEGTCEVELDCSDAQYLGRVCGSNEQCGEGGGCNNGVCECYNPGPGVCYPGGLPNGNICLDDDDCGGVASGQCELMGGVRYGCFCERSNEICGDGTIEGAEECDDGNNWAGDGCGATCNFETPSCEILLPDDSVVSGSAISIQILSQPRVTNSTARLYTGFSAYHNVSMTNGIGVRNSVLYRTAGNYVITGIVFNPLDVTNNTFAICTGDLAVYTNGDCGSLFMEVITGGIYSEPLYDDIDLELTFCDVGVFDEGTYTYTPGVGWTWECQGEAGGAVVECNAYELACGPADGGVYDALYVNDADLCGDTEYVSGFAGIQPGNLNYDGDPVSVHSYIWQCEVGGELISCEAEYVDSPMCDYPVGTPCDDADPNTTNDTWQDDCECVGTPIGFASCGDGILDLGEDCEAPYICDSDNSPCDPSDPSACSSAPSECNAKFYCSFDPTISCSPFGSECGDNLLYCENGPLPGCSDTTCEYEALACDFDFTLVAPVSGPYNISTEFEIEVDATVSANPWATTTITWGDTNSDLVDIDQQTYLSDPNPTHTYDTASATPYDVELILENPLDSSINDVCIIDSYTIDSVCGNGGAPEYDETCDDGNFLNSDQCNDQCELTSCGDLIRQNPNGELIEEECDGSADCTECTCNSGFAPDGNGACTSDPVPGVCGTVDGTSIYDEDDGGDAINSTSPNLCNVGAVVSFAFDTNTNTRSRDCEGENGGSNADCEATEESCGDTITNGGEGCDDGNTTSEDGCSDECVFECAAYILGDGETLCASPVPQSINDDYVLVEDCDVPPSDGCRVGCDTGFEFDNGICVVIVLEECGDIVPYWTQIPTTPTGELCTNDGDPVTGPTAQGGQPEVWDRTCTDEVGCSVINHYCGDGTIDNIANGWTSDDETCDDGAQNGDPGMCNSACDGFIFLEECGEENGTTYYTLTPETPDGELCTNGGNPTSGPDSQGEQPEIWVRECEDEVDCAVTNTFCGDGIEQTSDGEGCDDGNTEDGDGCSAICEVEPSECGDGIWDEDGVDNILGNLDDEECEDGNSNQSDQCANNCSFTYCGDAITQSPNGEGTGGPSDNGVESCDEGPDGGVFGEDFCTSECEVEQSPWCHIEINESCTTYTVTRGYFGALPTQDDLTLLPSNTDVPISLNATPGGEIGEVQLPGSWSDETTMLITATVQGNQIECQADISCVLPQAPFRDPDGEDASGISADTGVDLSVRSQIQVCENEEGCIVKYKSDDPTTPVVAENNETVDKTLDTIADDEVTNYGKSVLTTADVSDAFARALYIPIGNGLTALELFKKLGFFDLLEFEDGDVTKKDLIIAMTEILIHLGLLDEVEFELDNFQESADARDLRIVAVALRKVMQNSYLGFSDEDVRSRVAVGERSTDIGSLLCRRNGRTGCETEGFHQAASDAEPKTVEQFYDVDPSSRIGQALSYVNAQRNIFHQTTFNQEGNVQLSVLYKTLALSLELTVDSSTVQGANRGLGYLNALQKAGYFLDIDPIGVALNHSVTRGELQMYLTDLLQTAQLLPTTSSKAGPSTKLKELVTRGELVVALQQLIQMFEMYKQEISKEIVSRQEQTPERD